MARILVGCETSGRVRDAFLALGHDAYSCDLLDADTPTNRHIKADVRTLLTEGWDMAVLHPPCTRLCNSGVRWLSAPPKKLDRHTYTAEEVEAYRLMDTNARLGFMWQKLDEGAALFSACWNAPIPRIAVENPQMHLHAKARIVNYRPARQHVQPWWFGDPAFKSTGLYLKGLPPLVATNRLPVPKAGTPEHKAWSFIHRASGNKDRWKLRSATFPGIANAFAGQWGGLMPLSFPAEIAC